MFATYNMVRHFHCAIMLVNLYTLFRSLLHLGASVIERINWNIFTASTHRKYPKMTTATMSDPREMEYPTV